MAVRDLYDPECTVEVGDGHLLNPPNILQTALVKVDNYRAEFLEIAVTDSRNGTTNAVVLDRESATMVLQALVEYISNA